MAIKINNYDEYLALINKGSLTPEELAAIQEYGEKLKQTNNNSLGNVTEVSNENNIPNPFPNSGFNPNISENTIKKDEELQQQGIVIPKEILESQKIVETVEDDDDYDGKLDSNDIALSTNSDFLEDGDAPSVHPDEQEVRLDQMNEEKTSEQQVLEQMSQELNASIEEKKEEKKEEKPKNSIKTELKTSEEVEATDEDLKNIEESDLSDIKHDFTRLTPKEQKEIYETSMEEANKELESEREQVNNSEDDKNKYKIELLTSESEGLTEEESKILKALEEKRAKFLSKVVFGKEFATHESYRNKYNDAMKDFEVNEMIKNGVFKAFAQPTDDVAIKNLTKQIERTTVTGNKTKIALPLSGINVVMRAFTSASILGLIERLKGPMSKMSDSSDNYDRSIAFLEQRRIELNTIFNHIDYITDQNGKKINPASGEDEIFKLIKYPDLPQLYFAAFDATYRDKNRYSLTCNALVKENGVNKACRHRFDYYANNDEICYIPNQYITKEEFVALRNGFPEGKSTKDLKIVQMAEKIVDHITDTKYIIRFGIPSIYDYFETLQAMVSTFSNNELAEMDISRIDLADPDLSVDDYDYTDLYLKACLYMKSIKRPIIDNLKQEADGTKKAMVTFEEVTNKSNMLSFFSAMGPKDLQKVLKDKKFRALLKLKGIRHYISGAICPKCGTHLDPVPIDLEEVFFSTTTENTTI